MDDTCTAGSGGAYSETLSYLSGKDWVIALFFIGIFVIGFILSFNEIKKDGQKS